MVRRRKRSLEADEEPPAEVVIVAAEQRNLGECRDRCADSGHQRRTLIEEVRDSEEEAHVLRRLNFNRDAVVRNHRQLVDRAVRTATKRECRRRRQAVVRSQVLATNRLKTVPVIAGQVARSSDQIEPICYGERCLDPAQVDLAGPLGVTGVAIVARGDALKQRECVLELIRHLSKQGQGTEAAHALSEAQREIERFVMLAIDVQVRIRQRQDV